MANKKRKKNEEHENHERWLVSYADFITLLFAFFVVMYATSTNNEEKQKKFEDSVRENLKLTAPGAGAGRSQNEGSHQVNLNELVPELNSPITSFPKQSGPKEVADYINRSLEKKMEKSEREKMISGLRHDAVGVKISLAASRFFPTGSAKLKYSALKSLDQVADLIKDSDKKIIIEGHTDNTPIMGGSYESNWELASLRATSVVRYLIKYHNINPKNLAAISYADQKPVAENSSEEGRAKNRRIEVFITNEEIH